MQQFWRRLRRKPEEPAFDAEFPHLTPELAQQMRQRVRQHFESYGFRVEFSDTDVVLLRQGYNPLVLSLEPLANSVDPTFVEAFVQSAIASQAVSTLPTAQVYRHLRTMVMPSLPEDGRPRNADHEYLVDPVDVDDARLVSAATIEPVGQELVECFVFDSGQDITPIPTADLAQVDELEELAVIARKNTLRHLLETEIEVAASTVITEEFASGATMVRGSSVYISTIPVFMAEFLERRVPHLSTEEGVLFATPTPHILVVREVGSGQELAQALQTMATMAATIAFNDQDHAPVSPLLHLWNHGAISTVSNIDDDGNFLIIPDEYLLSRLHR